MTFVYPLRYRPAMTKKEKTARCRAILYGVDLNRPFGSQDARFAELLELLKGHKHWERKVGAGVRAVEVRQNVYANRCFWFLRVDGTETDISFVQALSPTTRKQDVQRAMRFAIQYQCDAFRELHGVPADWHVDHVYPLDRLSEEFVTACGLDWDQVAIVSEDGDVGSRLTNPAFTQAWQAWHEWKAQLQGLPARENLAKGNRVV